MSAQVTAPERERLDYAERWLRDGLHVLKPPVSVLQITVDMTAALDRLDLLRRTEGVSATTTHLLVQAAGRTLAANPDLHQIVAGRTRQRPTSVDIGLSVSGDTFVAPVLVIEHADRKSLADISAEVGRRAGEAQAKDRQTLALLRRWGWILPFAWQRRLVLRTLFSSVTFRRKGAGTFQISTVSADWGMTATFASIGVLIAGQVARRVVIVDNQPAVRPTMTLTLSGDHRIWNGRAATRFLAGVKFAMEHPAAEAVTG